VFDQSNRRQMRRSDPQPEDIARSTTHGRMAAMGTYDTALQMFVQAPRPVDMSRLSFLRWLAEHGRLEHQIEGPSTGSLVATPASTAPPPSPMPAYTGKG
jgi:hypothetical protein